MLKGKWCLVTGGGTGIGAGIAAAFAQESVNLVLVECPKRADTLKATAATCIAAGAGKVETHNVDLSDPVATDALATDVLARHGMIDILVNGAGMFDAEDMSVISGDPAVYDKVRVLHESGSIKLRCLFWRGGALHRAPRIVFVGDPDFRWALEASGSGFIRRARAFLS